jgi:tRNA pseudouridine38-40 synthase
MRYFIELAYDGSNYCGWQAQDNAATVQQQIEMALKYKLRLEAKVTGCGRTDSGVHARQFFAHFDAHHDLSSDKLKMATNEINGFLPEDIAVHRIFKVSDDVHARFDAISRTYKYYLNTNKDPFSRNYAWNYRAMMNLELMNIAAGRLLHHSDFTSFAKLHTDTKTNYCKITEAFWKDSGGMLIFTITANRFLRNMVRAIVGTLFDVGRGKISPEKFDHIIEALDRKLAGKSAPAKGLFLHEIKYDWDKVMVKTELSVK